MRSLFWPIVFLLVLGLCVQSVLPVWLDAQYVPNLWLAGLLALAITDIDLNWLWLAAACGLILDLQSALLVGSYCLGFALVYASAQLIFKRLVPADRVYLVLPIAYVAANAVLYGWIFLFGEIAAQIGWRIQPLFVLDSILPWIVAAVLGALSSVAAYVVWLEIVHRFDRPLRFGRFGQLK